MPRTVRNMSSRTPPPAPHTADCHRCGRTTDTSSSDYNEWELIHDVQHEVCPDCLTGAERQAIDGSDMEFIIEHQLQGQNGVGRLPECVSATVLDSRPGPRL